MYTRFSMLYRILNENKKNIGLATSALTSLYFTNHFLKNRNRFNSAYDILQKKLELGSFDSVKANFFNNSQKTCYQGSLFKSSVMHKSNEPLTMMSTHFSGTPRLLNSDGSYSELGAFSSETWPKFLDLLSDDTTLNVTLVHRKALSDTPFKRFLHARLTNNGFLFTHAILYVHDAQGNHAFYGYAIDNIRKPTLLMMLNDSLLTDVVREFTVYKDLTITGSKKQVQNLFEIVETAARESFTGVTFNCYTPVMIGLSKADALGFKTPDKFKERLLITVPMEQNGGAGMIYNKLLGVDSEEVVERVLRAKFQG